MRKRALAAVLAGLLFLPSCRGPETDMSGLAPSDGERLVVYTRSEEHTSELQ